jgi:hypothetical protein
MGILDPITEWATNPGGKIFPSTLRGSGLGLLRLQLYYFRSCRQFDWLTYHWIAIQTIFLTSIGISHKLIRK